MNKLNRRSKMVYIITIPILLSGYYTYTYGLTLLREDKNKLGGFAVIIFDILSTIGTITVLFIKNRI